uniref:Podocalyxin-like 2 n=1 Tax=Oryzias latipes TaxID=8090 RepID=A0A3P9ID82_ORYLA
MPGLYLYSLAVHLCCWGALSLGLTQHVSSLSLLSTSLFWRESPAESIQESARSKRHVVGELVRAQPHLVHDMGRPEIYHATPSQATMELANSSELNIPPSVTLDVARTRPGVDGSLDKEEDVEHMVHLTVPRQTNDFLGHPDSANAEAELLGGVATVDVSNEASGFNGMDTEDRGEEGGEDQERRGEFEWEKDTGDNRERKEEDVLIEENETVERTSEDVRDIPKVTHSITDSNLMTDFDPSKESNSSFPAAERDSGLQEHQAAPLLKLRPELWKVEKEEDVQSSGFEAFHLAIPSSAAATDFSGHILETTTLETDTGRDLVQPKSSKREETGEKEDIGYTDGFPQHPTEPEVGVAPSRSPLQPSVKEKEQLEKGQSGLGGVAPKYQHEVGGDTQRNMAKGVTRIQHFTSFGTDTPPITDMMELEQAADPVKPQQVVCLNWNELAGRGYVILNMTQNMNCEDFRAHQGVQLLKIIERVFSQKMNSPEGSWVLYLSKPTHHQHQLLMNVASGRGVIASQDVLDMLGQIRKSLDEVGIQNYSAASTCQSRPSKTRSDYGKLFVVLVIIGSICMVIITSGIIYICWQRRLPAAKTVFRVEELHHVENGYHDNPTLDVTNDREAEMQEKKPSTNGLAGGGDGGGEENSPWQVFINQAVTEEDEEEQDTHL